MTFKHVTGLTTPPISISLFVEFREMAKSKTGFICIKQVLAKNWQFSDFNSFFESVLHDDADIDVTQISWFSDNPWPFQIYSWFSKRFRSCPKLSSLMKRMRQVTEQVLVYRAGLLKEERVFLVLGSFHIWTSIGPLCS